MSTTYDGIELRFTIKPGAIKNLREQIATGLQKEPVYIREIKATKEAVKKLSGGISNDLERNPLKITKINADQKGITALKNSIEKSLQNRTYKIDKLKIKSLSLKDVKLSYENQLRSKIKSAIEKGDYKIKISNVDASAAIKSVQSQLQSALNKAGFFGVKETGGSGKRRIVSGDEIKRQEYKDGLKRVKDQFGSAKKEISSVSVLKNNTKVSDEIDRISQAIKNLEIRIGSMGKGSDVAFNGMLRDIEESIIKMNELANVTTAPVLNDIQKVVKSSRSKVSSRGDVIGDLDTIKLLDKAYEDLNDRIEKASRLSASFSDPSAHERMLRIVEQESQEYRNAVNYLTELRKLQINPIFDENASSALGRLNVSGLADQLKQGKEVQKLLDGLEKTWSNATKPDNQTKNITVSENFSAMEESYKRLIGLQEQYRTTANPKDREAYAAAIEKECVALERQINDTQKLIVETNKANQTLRNQQNKAAQPASAKSMTNLAGQIQDYLKANSSISKNPKTQGNYSELSGYLSTLRSAIAGTSNVTNQQLDDMAVKFKQTKQAVKDLGLSGQTMAERFLKGFEKFGGWMIITSALMELVNGMHKAVENVFELDAAMTQLRKVTDETETTYQKFYDTAVNRSKEIGSTLSNMINATADFARLGYNITDAEGLAEVANVYLAVGDNISSISDASESIISTLKAFYNETDAGMSVIQQGTQIIDEFNEVGRIVAQWQGRLVA